MTPAKQEGDRMDDLVEPGRSSVLVDDDASGRVPVARDIATGADPRQAVESGGGPRYRLMIPLSRVRLLP